MSATGFGAEIKTEKKIFEIQTNQWLVTTQQPHQFLVGNQQLACVGVWSSVDMIIMSTEARVN